MLNPIQLMLKEGLIISHDITRYNSVITTKLDQMNVDYQIDIIDKLEYNLTITSPTEDIIDIINHDAFVIGYFPSYCWVTLNNGMKNSFKWSKFNYNQNIQSLKIKFESKYDDGLYNNTNLCPDILYHITPQINKNSILKKGIYPKSKNRLSNHPERIHLFSDIDKYELLLKSMKFLDRTDMDYMLLEIDCSKYKLILHTDPNYRIGWFTYDNINPSNIKIISEFI